MNSPLHIALTADSEIPVPPKLYGGIERIIDLLARGLTDRGHEVTLFAHPDSRTAGNLVPWPGESSQSIAATVGNALTLRRAVNEGRFDIVHSFSRVAYLLPLLPRSIPKLMTYQRPISPRSIRMGRYLSKGSLEFSAISEWMVEHVSDLAPWHIVPNGVSLAAYDFNPQVEPDAPLVFLGRIEEIKGPHLAIELARRTARKLVIAGNIPPEKQAWFDVYVAPHIDDEMIRYIGPVDDEQKNGLLGSAAAFLMPILWDEPFGIVMAEAMCCGTPVIGYSRGAVPEVVVDGVTGYVGNNLDDLVTAVGRLDMIDRQACRHRVEEHYSESAIVDGYIDVYRQLCAKQSVGP